MSWSGSISSMQLRLLESRAVLDWQAVREKVRVSSLGARSRSASSQLGPLRREQGPHPAAVGSAFSSPSSNGKSPHLQWHWKHWLSASETLPLLVQILGLRRPRFLHLSISCRVPRANELPLLLFRSCPPSQRNCLSGLGGPLGKH